MKSIISIFLLALMIFACRQEPVVTQSDLDEARTAAVAVVDGFHNALKGKHGEAILSLIAEDALLCGTDPSELWDKKAYADLLTRMFSDSSLVIENYPIDKREVRVSEDGNSVIILDQFIVGALSKRIPARLITRVARKGDEWLIDFSSISMIPTNEDLHNLDSLLEK